MIHSIELQKFPGPSVEPARCAPARGDGGSMSQILKLPIAAALGWLTGGALPAREEVA